MNRPPLTAEQIRSIYVGYLSDEPKLHIAKRVGIDRATVAKYFEMLDGMHESQVVALIMPKCHKGHTSFKCLVCGRACDNIKSEEFQTIRALRRQVADLEHQLSLTHENNHNNPSSNPITRISP